MPDSPFPQPLSRSTLVFLLAWDPLLHIPYISSPNHHVLFAVHAIFFKSVNIWKNLRQEGGLHIDSHSFLRYWWQCTVDHSARCAVWTPWKYFSQLIKQRSHLQTALFQWLFLNGWILHYSLSLSCQSVSLISWTWQFWYRIFSQGSVATYVRCGGIFNNYFVANFLQNMPGLTALLPRVWCLPF